jgi:replicative DNA helicase
MNMEALKVPPHSAEAETALLAAMIESNRLINEIDYIHSDEFYRLENQIIYTRLQALAFVGKPVDAVTLVDALDSAGELDRAGGTDYIVELMTQSRGPANANHYANIIREKAMKRRLIRIGHEIAESGFGDGDVQESIDHAQGLVMGIETSSESEPEHINSILRDAIAEIDRRHRGGNQVVGVPSGFIDLDRLITSFQPGQLIIVAGRPGSGKTTVAMNIVENVTIGGKFCLVFNLEMTKRMLAMKSLSSLGKIPYDSVKKGEIDDHCDKLTAATARFKDRTLYIDDNARLTSAQLVSRARKVAQKCGKKIDLIVLDYLQLLNDKGDGHERITKISRAIKIAAKELDCPIIALSQLSRALESRANKRPILADLRESGSLEQDADVVIMVYRDEIHEENSNQKGITEIIVRKQREGETGTVYLASRLDICRFENMTHPYQPIAEQRPQRIGGFSHLDN